MSEQPDRSGGLLSWIGRSVANKVLTAVLVVAVVAVLVWWFRLPAEDREAAIHAVKMLLLWVLIAGALPWGLFFVPPLVLRVESNAASALMLGAYTLVDMLVALGLMDWEVSGRLAWGAMILGFLLSLAYNFVVCESLAYHSED